jgi:hypothetical protein
MTDFAERGAFHGERTTIMPNKYHQNAPRKIGGERYQWRFHMNNIVDHPFLVFLLAFSAALPGRPYGRLLPLPWSQL